MLVRRIYKDGEVKRISYEDVRGSTALVNCDYKCWLPFCLGSGSPRGIENGLGDRLVSCRSIEACSQCTTKCGSTECTVYRYTGVDRGIQGLQGAAASLNLCGIRFDLRDETITSEVFAKRIYHSKQ